MELVLAWFVGDAFKTLFFLFRKSPYQFLLCGMIQLVVDVAIAVQMHTYAPHPLPSPSDDPRTLHAKSRKKRQPSIPF